MVVIIHRENNRIFESDKTSVPDAIIDLYNYCGGRIGKELFSRIITGMTTTSSIEDMVILFEQVTCLEEIKKIYVFADKYYDSRPLEDAED